MMVMPTCFASDADAVIQGVPASGSLLLGINGGPQKYDTKHA